MPIEIPGKSIKPPDRSLGVLCRYCHRVFLIPKMIINPKTKKVELACPYCGKKL
jgi:uncharacterized Zn-finger protein